MKRSKIAQLKRNTKFAEYADRIRNINNEIDSAANLLQLQKKHIKEQITPLNLAQFQKYDVKTQSAILTNYYQQHIKPYSNKQKLIDELKRQVTGNTMIERYLQSDLVYASDEDIPEIEDIDEITGQPKIKVMSRNEAEARGLNIKSLNDTSKIKIAQHTGDIIVARAERQARKLGTKTTLKKRRF